MFKNRLNQETMEMCSIVLTLSASLRLLRRCIYLKSLIFAFYGLQYPTHTLIEHFQKKNGSRE